MLDSRQKRKVKGLLYHRVTISILFLFLLIVAHSTWDVYSKKRESEELERISLMHKNELESRDNELKSQIDRLQTEPGIEAEIRSKFNVSKDKENVVLIVDSQSSTTKPAEENKGLWERIKSVFGL
jgi:cell division protein FtsB